MLTAKQLCEFLTYDPGTGIFRWRVARNNRIKAESVAGSLHRGTGYHEIHINGRTYLAHRLAWLYMTGDWPPHDIDHRNLVKDDNRWSNLREATQSLNNANRRVMGNSKTGVKGVTKIRSRYRAQITINGERIYLGYYKTVAEAAAIYAEAAAVAFDDYARTS